MSVGFRLPCYLSLKRQLGEIDACAECQEIAVRDFLAVCRGASDQSAEIQRRSRVHGIRVDSVDLAQFARRNTELQLVAVSYALEAFLNDLISDHPRLGSRNGRGDGETLLDFVLGQPPWSESKGALKKSLEYRIREYYRLVRNRIAHPGGPATVGSCKLLSELQADCKANEPYQRLSAPNDSGSLEFDDYLQFTRASKRLALELCQVAPLTDDDLREWLEQQRPQKGPKKGTEKRRLNAMVASLRIQFGITPDRAETIVQSMKGC